ncbi:MAG: hypothetical protein KC621_16450 [Myxococcales bacterium]|nr:hypothetical protein [Myxococcales bacterium]
MAWMSLLALAGAEAAMIEGVARDAKGGAVILLDDGAPVYVDGLETWPPGVHGLRIRAEGEEVSERYVPAATVAPDGAISQGTTPGSALDRVLRPTWWCPTPVPGGAWTLSIDGGNHDLTEVRADGSTVRWTYRPVRPEQSSSGTYSGGVGASGALDAEHVTALWRSLSEVTRLPEERGGEMGTARIHVMIGAVEQRLVVDRATDQALGVLIR